MTLTNTRLNTSAPLRAALALLVLTMLTSLPLHAQRWLETFGGGAPGGEEGRAVIEAANSDIVTAGTERSTFGTPIVYVVRTDANGALLWHLSYDVDNSGQCGATDIKEYPNGDLAVVGWAQYPAGIRAFAMRLDAAGTVLWVSRFQTGDNSWAHSAVIATQGNGTSTNPDDLILAGYFDVPGSVAGYDGLLARLDANGNPIWIKTYDLTAGSTTHDVLYGVDEAQITGIGDIVATGSSTDLAGVTSVWVLRVDGNTGAIGGAPQGSAIFTTPANVLAQGHAIIELRNGAFNGDLAITGITNNTMNSADVLILQVAADPCDPANPRALQRLGEFVVGSADEGFDLCEITDPAVGNVGNVMVTGYTKVTANVEVFLQEFQPGSMFPVGNMYHYGDKGEDIGYSLAEVRNAPVTQGYAVTGFTNSPALIQPGNTQDELLFKVNGTLDLVCYYERIKPPTDTTYLNPTCTPAVETNLIDTIVTVEPTITPFWGAYLVCFASPKVRVAPAAAEGAISAVTVYPRPSGRDASISLGYTLDSDATVAITVSDMVGRIVYSSKAARTAGSVTELIPTAGWSAGTYVATVTAGGRSSATRLIVADR